MKYFVMSDIHIDFYMKKQTKVYAEALTDFEKFFENYMLPAEGIICAGDVANDYYNQVNFYKFLTTKYKEVYVVFGNHDLGIPSTFGNGNPFKYSEDKCEAIKKEFENSSVHILDGNIINDIAGTMGMCDFHYSTAFDLGIPYKIKKWQKSWYDGRVWHIKNPEWKNEYLINPVQIWVHEKNKMIDLVKQQPKVMVTHFCPMQLGVQKEYENSDSTTYFYFDGKEILDIFDHETWWFCGHIHTMCNCDYVNSKGNTIHIMALPNAYPNENPYIGCSFENKLDKDTGKYYGVLKSFTKEYRIIEL